MENANKNPRPEPAENNPIPNNVPFTSDNQPSPEAKSKGWQERRERLELVKAMDKCMGVTRKEYLDMLDDMENHPEKYTNREVMIAKEYFEKGYMRHFIELNIPKPQEIDMTSKGEKIEGIQVEIINPRDDSET